MENNIGAVINHPLKLVKNDRPGLLEEALCY